MKLNRVQRWLISTQHRILAELTDDRDEVARSNRIRQVLECGYELEYDRYIPHVYPDDQCLTSEQCTEVLDILSMYRALQESYAALEDTSGIDASSVTFPGFDGDTERAQLGYCRYVHSEGRFGSMPPGPDDFDSHAPSLDAYRRMLRVWKPLATSDRLSKPEIVSITVAMPRPESQTV